MSREVGWKAAVLGVGAEQASRQPGGWQSAQLTRPICSPNTKSSWFSAHLSWGKEGRGVRGQKSAKQRHAAPWEGPRVPHQGFIFHFVVPQFVSL